MHWCLSLSIFRLVGTRYRLKKTTSRIDSCWVGPKFPKHVPYNELISALPKFCIRLFLRTQFWGLADVFSCWNPTPNTTPGRICSRNSMQLTLSTSKSIFSFTRNAMKWDHALWWKNTHIDPDIFVIDTTFFKKYCGIDFYIVPVGMPLKDAYTNENRF